MSKPTTLEEAREQGIAPWKVVMREDFHIVVFIDQFPVTEGHLLFVPQYNTPELISEAFSDALRYGNQLVDSGYCDAYNIGLNMGEAAGQSIMWPHVHLIPRRKGDVENPRGGIRHIIPGKGNYQDDKPTITPGSTADVMRKAHELAKKQLDNYKLLDAYEETDRLYRIEDARD